jgi:hypothetical protein
MIRCVKIRVRNKQGETMQKIIQVYFNRLSLFVDYKYDDGERMRYTNRKL